MSVLSIPNSFTNGTPADATLVNANFNAVVGSVNNINSANIGVLGTYASQVIPTSGAQATFGGSVGYTFNNGLTVENAGLTVLNAPLLVQGGTLSASPLSGFSAPVIDSFQAGDICAQLGNSFGRLFLGGAFQVGILDYGSLVTGAFSFTGGPVHVNMAASQSTPGLLVNGAASITGNLLQVDLTSGGTHALLVNSGGNLLLAPTINGTNTLSSPPPFYTSNGSAVATTMHGIIDVVAAISGTTTITFSGSAVMATGGAYVAIIYDETAAAAVNTYTTISTTQFSFASINGHTYRYAVIGF